MIAMIGTRIHFGLMVLAVRLGTLMAGCGFQLRGSYSPLREHLRRRRRLQPDRRQHEARDSQHGNAAGRDSRTTRKPLSSRLAKSAKRDPVAVEFRTRARETSGPTPTAHRVIDSRGAISFCPAPSN